MNAAQAQKLQSSEVVVRDRTRVFGYSGGAPGMLMDAKKSNLDCNPIEGGRLLMFAPGKDGYLGGLDAKGKFKQAYVDMMPTDYANLVDRKFHLNDDIGFRMLPMLTKVPYKAWSEVVGEKKDGSPNVVAKYEDEADAYFNVVSPPLNDCPYGLFQKIAHHNPEVGTGELIMTPCPTCRLAELKSDECSERIYNASNHLDSEILLKLRDTLIEANEATLTHIASKSSMVVSDIARTIAGQKGFRTTLNAVDRIHLRMMHKEENQQANTTVDLIKTLGQEIANATKQSAAPQGVTISTEEHAEYQAYLTRKANMAKAREAKGVKDESNTDEG
jgi:hypothetical protein